MGGAVPLRAFAVRRRADLKKGDEVLVDVGERGVHAVDLFQQHLRSHLGFGVRGLGLSTRLTQVMSPSPVLRGYRGTSLIRNHPVFPRDPTVGLCLGPYGARVSVECMQSISFSSTCVRVWG